MYNIHTMDCYNYKYVQDELRLIRINIIGIIIYIDIILIYEPCIIVCSVWIMIISNIRLTN